MRWLVPLLLLAACVASPTQDELARAAAREAIANTVGARFPMLPVRPVTDCVVNNATAAEIFGVASDVADGQPGPATAEIVGSVMTRPGTIECLEDRALPALLQ